MEGRNWKEIQSLVGTQVLRSSSSCARSPGSGPFPPNPDSLEEGAAQVSSRLPGGLQLLHLLSSHLAS